ncbi:MAG TPA: HrpE/YscL family type III secretion apparatus protein [Candidatus Thermoplasmatota archaeon]|nr:HrpE/YscL family type III secretion apparatus protein [Candidatus Thermoplasmatota archaeon]
MKSDLLMRIKDAETAANQRTAAAEAEAKQVLAEARRQAEAILADARQQADFAYAAKVEQARKQAESEASRTVQKGGAQGESARKAFQSGLPQATQRALKVIEGRLE